MWLAVCGLLLSVARGQEAGESVDQLIRRLDAGGVEGADVATLRAAARDGVIRWVEQQDTSGLFRVLTREEYRRLQAATRGERHGIGLGIVVVPRYGIRIQDVFPGTPAEEAGLEAGEVVVGVNGEPVTGCTPEEVRDLLVAAHDEVVLDVLDPDGLARRVRLVPRRYVVPPVSVIAAPGFHLVRLHHFGPGASQALRRILGELPPEDALVLDVRDTGEGSLAETLQVMAPFVGGGGPVAERLGGSGEVEALLVPPAPRWVRRFAILVNGGTRGLGELFVAGVRAGNEDVMVVGTATAGQAVLPAWVEADPDTILQVGGHRLALADGSTWNSVGVIPDVVVQPFLGVVVVPPPAPLPDLQVDAALRVVRSP